MSRDVRCEYTLQACHRRSHRVERFSHLGSLPFTLGSGFRTRPRGVSLVDSFPHWNGDSSPGRIWPVRLIRSPVRRLIGRSIIFTLFLAPVPFRPEGSLVPALLALLYPPLFFVFPYGPLLTFCAVFGLVAGTESIWLTRRTPSWSASFRRREFHPHCSTAETVELRAVIPNPVQFSMVVIGCNCLRFKLQR